MINKEGKKYTIGEVSKKSGVSLHTLRFYDKKGLIGPVGRTVGKYRLYDKEVFRKLTFIDISKNLGFTLREIKGMLQVRVESPEGFKEAKAIIRAKLTEIEERIAALEIIKKALKQLMECFTKGTVKDKCPVIKILEDKAPKEVREVFRQLQKGCICGQ